MENQKYSDAVRQMKQAILSSQCQAAKGANAVQLSLYYGIGRYVSNNTRQGVWGTGAIEIISEQLQKELPGLRGFSSANIKKMRIFHDQWSDILKSSPVANEIDVNSLLPIKSSPKALVAIELKRGAFKPSYLGQLNFYLNALDSKERCDGENPSVGLLLCKDLNKSVVELAVRSYSNPMGVATYRLPNDIPEEYKVMRPIMERAQEILDQNEKEV